MNKELQSLINEAAKEHVRDFYPFAVSEEDYSGPVHDAFKAGAAFALSPDCLRIVLKEFLERVDTDYVNDLGNCDTWFDRETGVPHTTEELVTIFIQHKQESNGTK